MDSIEDGATIRIGFKEYDKRMGNVPCDFKVPTYSLKINKKSVLICDCGGPSRDYIEIYKDAAKKIAELMNEKGVKNYVVNNGERVRMTNHLWVSCGYIPKDGEELFLKTLEDSLN